MVYNRRCSCASQEQYVDERNSTACAMEASTRLIRLDQKCVSARVSSAGAKTAERVWKGGSSQPRKAKEGASVRGREGRSSRRRQSRAGRSTTRAELPVRAIWATVYARRIGSRAKADQQGYPGKQIRTLERVMWAHIARERTSQSRSAAAKDDEHTGACESQRDRVAEGNKLGRSGASREYKRSALRE
jgi:hypothetical protein